MSRTNPGASPLNLSNYMKEPCDICHKKPWFRVHAGQFICETCKPKFSGFPSSVVSTVKLGNQGVKATTKEIDEVKRMRMLPYNKPGGGYWHGRMGENGKIQERPLKT